MSVHIPVLLAEVLDLLAPGKKALMVEQVVGIENASQIFQAARHPKSFISLDTADHLLTDSNDSRYVGKVIAAWALRYV